MYGALSYMFMGLGEGRFKVVIGLASHKRGTSFYGLRFSLCNTDVLKAFIGYDFSLY